jgi:hypothetical protein
MAINPLQQPINYAVDVQSPFEAALGGIKIGAGLEELNVARQKREMETQQLQAAQAQQAQFQSGLNSFFAKPPEQRTYEELQPLLVGANKQQFDALKLVGEQMGAERLGSAKRFTSQVLLALEANPTTAQTMLEERIAAETDPNQKRGFQTILDISKESPEKAAQFVELFGAGSLGEEWYKGIAAVRGERRTAAEAPVKMREATAKAIVEEQKAKFAPQKFGLEINLTESQIKQADAAMRASDAAAKKSGADAERAEAEAKQMAMGVIPVDKRPEAETKIRAEYNNQTKPYQEVKSAYGRMLASEDTAVGDLSLIFGYMKMLDPGSVVREGEFATAQNAAGVPERIQNVYNRVITGERLNASQRKSFKGQAKGLFNSALDGEKTVRTGLERIATGYGLNTNNIFYTATEVAPVESVNVAGQTFNRPVNFTDAQWSAYKQSVEAK